MSPPTTTHTHSHTHAHTTHGRYNLTEAVGSWAYMAPEVVLGQPYNEKVDVFSFGVILFEVLNRKLMLVDEIKNDPRKDAQVE